MNASAIGPDPASGGENSPRLRAAIERQTAALEKAWAAGESPRIAEFAALDDSFANDQGRALAWELVLVDMEFRWRAGAQGRRLRDSLGTQARLEDYLLQLPLLGSLQEVPVEAIAEEFRVRQLWGDRPGYDHFVSRFPARMFQLPEALRRVKQELAADGEQLLAGHSAERANRPADDPRAPLSIDDFLIEQHLGTGGMGKVYRARQKSLDRRVAIKALLKSRQDDPAAVDRFLEEARLLARLRYPGIVGIHGVGRFPGGGYFLVLDLIEGEDLQQRLKRGPLSAAEAVLIVIHIAQAIEYAHRQGIVHCDLKPGNVLVDPSAAVFVTDFGLAQLMTPAEEALQKDRWTGGTVSYMAPERLTGNVADPRVDVYGIGAILCALLTGEPPGAADRAHDSSAASPIPPQVWETLKKCLARRPEDRFATASEVAAALRGPSANA